MQIPCFHYLVNLKEIQISGLGQMSSFTFATEIFLYSLNQIMNTVNVCYQLNVIVTIIQIIAIGTREITVLNEHV